MSILPQLERDLFEAANRRLSAGARSSGSKSPASRTRRLRPLRAAVIAVALAMVGAAIALAATGVLTGSPVKEQGKLSPNAGFGLPAPGGSRLLTLRAADPEGGLPWGMRLVHTTRGEICVQVGRLDGDQLGQLGIDGAFHDDARFHALAPDILPQYGDSGDVSCILDGQIAFGSWRSGDRSAAPDSLELTRLKPTAKDLRSISWGLLGPHALSITYHTAAGVQTRSVAPGTGAYLIVSGVSHVPRDLNSLGAGAEALGWTSGHEVAAGFPPPGDTSGAVIAATYRFGSFTCSIGYGAPVTTSCPMPPPTPMSAFNPTRSLHRPVSVKTVLQSPAACSKAFLLDPCYRAEVEFQAPYAVSSAGSEYAIETSSRCKNARPNSWGINHDIKRAETVYTMSTGLFRLCATADEFEIRYLNQRSQGPSAGSPHESVIFGTGILRGNPSSEPGSSTETRDGRCRTRLTDRQPAQKRAGCRQ
jgi:hypothetical protein